MYPSNLHITDRGWLVLEKRTYGITLARIGEELNLSRERIRQIETLAINKIASSELVGARLLKLIEPHWKSLWKPYQNRVNCTNASRLLQECLTKHGTSLSQEDAKRLLVILRLAPKTKLFKEFRNMVYLSCTIEPHIVDHPRVAEDKLRFKQESKKLSYIQLAKAVLEDKKEPLHWTKIAIRAERLGRRESFNSTALYNVLQDKKYIFVRTDQGTYGLREWGLRQADTYTSIITRILENKKTGSSFGYIYQKVNEERPITKESLQMFLDGNAKYYRSVDNLYGLRGWLPLREKQNLHTPRWLIEDSKSFQRLEFARKRGHKV